MNRVNRLPSRLSVANILILVACGVLGQTSNYDYTPLALENRPLKTSSLLGAAGVVQLGLAYTSDDNYSFGEYRGLYQDQVTLIGNLQWQDFKSGDSYWQVSGFDLGLDTREGKVTWHRPGRMRVGFGFDSQIQLRNDEGRTPFRGNTNLRLPDNWVSGLSPSDWSTLDESLGRFDRELKRDTVFINFDMQINDHWKFESGFSYEKKQGDSDVGGAIYSSAGSGDAVLLKQPIDYRTTEFDLGLTYSSDRLNLEGRLSISDFDNEDEVLIWQNPYSSFGSDVQYPAGVGGLGLAPDNEQVRARFTGQYLVFSRVRLQVDGSLAETTQDQSFLDYSVNPALAVTVQPPRKDYDGQAETSTFNTRLLLQPLRKLDAEVFYKYRNRNVDADREGYLYIRGDGGHQPRTALTVYNTNHDYRSRSAGIELGYRLPLRSKLRVAYNYEEIERENAAVEKTEEDRYILKYRIQPWSNITAKLAVEYADRAADTYHWAQSYFALLDAELINATPDNQRYINHPAFSQYYLANRDQLKTKADVSYLPSDRWHLNLNLELRDDDYDQSTLGLTNSEWYSALFAVSFVASESFSANAFVGYDEYRTEQSSRAFRGGQEKNAFAVYPPLPQASDPAQNWSVDSEDSSISLGAGVEWQVADDLALSLNFRYVETEGEQDFKTPENGNLLITDLPTVETRLHQLEVSGTWTVQDNISVQLDYQYYRYRSDDWAWKNVEVDTIDKVLTFGQGNPNDHIHYVGASVIYRWQ